MDRENAPHPGRRIASYRKHHQLSQADLAAAAHVSLSLLSKVESGHKPATDQLMKALAPVLRVSMAELAGRPPEPRRLGARTALGGLHAALLRHDDPVEPGRPARRLARLREDVDLVTELRSRGAYGRLGPLLPSVMDELAWAAHGAPDGGRAELFKLLTHVYFAAHAMAYKLGDHALASLAEERIAWSSGRTGDPLLAALATWTRCHSLLETGGPNWDVGLARLERARRDLDGRPAASGPEALSVYGALLLREAVIAAKSRRADLARSRLDEAWELVARGARDANPRSVLTAGPVNTRIVQAAVTVELGDAGAALEVARGLRIPAAFSRVRASHHYIDMSVPLVMAGKTEEALVALLTAEQYAAQQTLWHPTTRATVSRLMAMRRNPSTRLQGLTRRILQAGAPSPLSSSV